MRRRRKTQSDDADVDMTPMLDIVFIMLIFFIVTATFLDETGIDLTQPPPPPDEPPPPKPLELEELGIALDTPELSPLEILLVIDPIERKSLRFKLVQCGL